MAACTWYSPTCPQPQGLGDQGHPLGDQTPGPRACGPARPSGTSSPSARGAGRAPGVGEQHEGEQAGHLGVLGQRGVHGPGQADGLAGQVGPGQVGTAAGGVALVEEEVQDVQHRPQALGAHPRATAARTARPTP